MSGAIAVTAVQGGAAAALALGFALLAVRRMGVSVAICAGQAMAVAAAALMQGNVAVAVAEVVVAVAVAGSATVLCPAWPATALSPAGSATPSSPAWPASALYPAGSAIALSPAGSATPLCPAGSATALGPAWRRNGRRQAARAVTPSRTAALEQRGAGLVVAGAVLAALALAVPVTGIAFATVLLGLLVSAGDRRPEHQVLGLAAAQSGLALSALAVGLTGWGLGLAVLPLLPVVGAAGLWLGADRRRVTALLAPRFAGWIDATICCLALLCAASLPWQLGLGADDGWRLDARAVHMALLLCAVGAAGSWGQRATRSVWGSRVAILAGSVLAVAAAAPLSAWAGTAVAMLGAAAAALPDRAEAWRRLRLGCTGLALALFGAIALHAARPPASAMAAAMLGYGSLAVLAPELTVVAVALIVRLPAPPLLLLATGLAGLAFGAAASWLAVPSWPGLGRPSSHPSSHEELGCDAATAPDPPGRMAGSGQVMTAALVGLAQGGVAVFAFGLGTPGGAFAGLLQLTLLVLTQCALLLSRPEGLDRLAALAGLGGIPPFGLFASLALVVAATAAADPFLLLPLGVGLAAVAWVMLRQLPAGWRLCASPAWLPLALLLLCGFAMPAPWLAWFRLAAR